MSGTVIPEEVEDTELRKLQILEEKKLAKVLVVRRRRRTTPVRWKYVFLFNIISETKTCETRYFLQKTVHELKEIIHSLVLFQMTDVFFVFILVVV